MRMKIKSLVRPGDLAYVAGAGLGALPLFRITKVETDGDGNIVTYYLTESSNLAQPGDAVPAERVTAVFANILNAQE